MAGVSDSGRGEEREADGESSGQESSESRYERMEGGGRGLQEAEMDSVELKYLVSLRGENMTARRLIAEGKQISCQKI